jgi:5'-nucleotidase
MTAPEVLDLGRASPRAWALIGDSAKGKRMRGITRTAALVVGLAALTSGCMFFPAAVRNAAFQPQPVPWWCTSDAGADLGAADCQALSLQLDVALESAHANPRASDAVADGATSTPYIEGIGAGFELRGPTTTFDAAAPDTILYDAVDSDAQVVGLEWNITGTDSPAGFVGSNDVWTDSGSDVWTLRAWIVRPFENQPEVFAATHPCLAEAGAVYDLEAPCYTTSHPLPLEILVTNDDGYAAPGIDAVVEALRVLPGVNVTVVAPATDRSGTGDQTTPGGVTAFAAETESGHPAVAVNGFPADSVLHALRVLGENPDLVVSGINNGQNIGPVVDLSGTIGAARTGARNGIPALASSQGLGSPPDFPSGVDAVLDWVEAFRLGRAGPPYQEVANVNIPTCTAGAIRGTVELPVATSLNGRPFNPSDCTSTVTALADDVDGFIHGFVTLSDVGLN